MYALRTLVSYFFDISVILVKPYFLKLCMVVLQKLTVVYILRTFILSTDKLAEFPLLL
jgi:hypothetical protein